MTKHTRRRAYSQYFSLHAAYSALRHFIVVVGNNEDTIVDRDNDDDVLAMDTNVNVVTSLLIW